MSGVGLALQLFAPYVQATVILLLTVLVAWLVGLTLGRLTRRATPPVRVAARRLGIVVVAVIGGTLTLQALGVNTAVLLLVIGLLGVAALVALRDPLGNYGSKYFSDIYTPFKVGDTIAIRGVSGRVIEINPMSTVLLSDRNELVSVPNSDVLREVVVNTSPQAWKEITVPVTLGGHVDLPTFESELLKSLGKIRARLDPRFPPVLATKSRTTQSTDLVLTVMIRRPEDRDAIAAEINSRLTEVQERVRGVTPAGAGR
jgi:small conductance mechanosensitive channel